MIGGHVRTSRYFGFLAMVLGALVIGCAAALPVTADLAGTEVVDARFRIDGCGPAISAFVRDSQPDCQAPAKRRLAVTTTGGVVAMLVGLVMLAGGDRRGSRIAAPAGGISRRPPGGSRGSKRYMPG